MGTDISFCLLYQCFSSFFYVKFYLKFPGMLFLSLFFVFSCSDGKTSAGASSQSGSTQLDSGSESLDEVKPSLSSLDSPLTNVNSHMVQVGSHSLPHSLPHSILSTVILSM